MLKEGIIEEVISPLLKQLASARCVAPKIEEDDSSSEINALFDKIERDARDMKDVFRRVDRWEEGVIGKFGFIVRHINDMLEEGGKSTALSRLRSIHLEMSNLKDSVTSPLQLPLIESNTASSSATLPSKSEALQPSEDWQRFELEKKILESSAMSSLQVSYDNLELQLKLCLLCFSIFPENSIIKKRTLIHWWIGEGLVTPRTGKTAEEIGDRCFHKLIAEGLIEPIYSKCNRVINRCKIHPWIRRMLISVATRAQFFDFDLEGSPTSDFSLCRRACLVTSKGEAASSQQMTMRSRSSPEELLTLFNVNEQYIKFEKSWFSEMRKVAVLQLGRWQTLPRHHIEVENTDFLEGLRYFNHLKYLSLRGISRITELPASIGKLTNLTILDLQACHNLERLTVGITSLKKLSHLDVSECHLLEHMPKGIGSLVDLQVLKGFVIGDSRSKDPCRLSELAKLEKLRKLSINIGSKAQVTEQELNELRGLRALRSLTITWGVVMLPTKKEHARLTRAATMTTTSLSLPPYLEKLDLRCFPTTMVPNWLNPSSLSSLKKLYIRGGLLKSLGLERSSETWNVEVLHLKFLSELEVEWAQLQARFPCLDYMEILKCNKLRSFPCDARWYKDRNEKGIEGPSTSSCKLDFHVWITWRSSNVTSLDPSLVMQGGLRIEMRRG